MTLTVASSPDGQWCAVRRGRQIAWYALGGEEVGECVARTELPDPSSELILLGPPTMAVILTRAGDTTVAQLALPPTFERVAEISLPGRWSSAAVTGTRAALVSEDARSCSVLRAAGRSLTAQALDPGGLVDRVLGMERSQLAVLTTKKLELWDAVAGRPLTRLQLQLPPPPRTIGVAAGHWWVVRGDRPQILLLRLSDGRPFQHEIGEPVRAVVSHAASPWLVVVTERGLLRLSCFAHALVAIDVPPAESYGIAPAGDEAMLLGATGIAHPPWRVRLSTPVPLSAGASTSGVVIATAPVGAGPTAATPLDATAPPLRLGGAGGTAPPPPRSETPLDAAAVAARDAAELETSGAAPPTVARADAAPGTPLEGPRAAPRLVPPFADGPAPLARAPVPAWASTAPAPTSLEARGEAASASPPPSASLAEQLRAIRDRADGADLAPEVGRGAPERAPESSRPASASALDVSPARAAAPPRDAAATAIEAASPTRAAARPPDASWRAQLTRFGVELSREGGLGVASPPRSSTGELATLSARLRLGEQARQVTAALYAAWLAGRPFVPNSRLVALLGEDAWAEALGTGELGELGLLRHRAGAVALRRSVADALDGRPWLAIRTLGGAAATQLPRELARIAVAAWPSWLARLGRVALVTGSLRRAVLEARLAELVAVSFEPLAAYPAPWPRGAQLLVVTDVVGGLTELLPELDEPAPSEPGER
ncbi:MAG: hypothetical protein R3B48_05380 [Kofleriaceae bacterium]